MGQNEYGFEEALKQINKLMDLDEDVTMEALEEAATYFVNQLRPQLAKSNKDSTHMADALKVKIEGEKVIIYFEDYGWYWYLVEHGHKKRGSKGFVKRQSTIMNTFYREKKTIEKIMLQKIMNKMEA